MSIVVSASDKDLGAKIWVFEDIEEFESWTREYNISRLLKVGSSVLSGGVRFTARIR